MAVSKILFIPGLSFGGGLFAHQTEHLADVATCEVVPVTTADGADQTDAILAAAGPEPVAIIAHSGGTLAAIAAAAAAPDRVSHLVLQGAMGTELPPIAEFLTGMIADLQHGDLDESRAKIRGTALGTGHCNQDELEAAIVKVQSEIPTEQFIEECRFIINNMNQSAVMGRIAARTLFVHARQDKFFDLELTQSLADQVPGAALVVLEDSGHLACDEQPAAMTALIRLWLTLPPA